MLFNSYEIGQNVNMYWGPKKDHAQSRNEGYRRTLGRASAAKSILQLYKRHDEE